MKRLAIGTAALLVMVACSGSSGGSTTSDGSTPSDAVAETGVADGEDASIDSAAVESFMAAEQTYVSLEPDLLRSVSQTVDPGEASVLQAVGDDGTKFVLEIPAGSVAETVIVELAPASGLGGPAVNIEPEGLELMSTATLRITPSEVGQNSESVWVDLGGLVSRYDTLTEDDGTIVFPLQHFSGYGQAAPDFVGPPISPVDQLRLDIGNALEDAWKNGRPDLDPSVGDKIQQVWESYVRPLLERAGKECVGRAAINEYLRINYYDQLLGTERLAQAMNSKRQAERMSKVFDSLRKCAREDCSQGKSNAIPDLVVAYKFADLFDIPYGDAKELFDALSPAIDPVWGKCKFLQIFASFSLKLSAALPVPSTISEVVAGTGVVAPGDSGQSTAFGLMEAADGVEDAYSKGGSMIATAILTGNPTPMGGLCSVGSFGRGRMEARLEGAGTESPTLKLDPFLASANVKCGDINAEYTPQVFLMYLLAKAMEEMSISHTFTPDERWPKGGNVVLGYDWNDEIDVASKVNSMLGERWLDSATIKVRVRLRAGSENGPQVEAPPAAGLMSIQEMVG